VRLDGIHHITAICADAPGNIDFYVRVLGLRLVKKTVNFGAPDVYHLYYWDEQGSAGSILTFFEFPDAAPGRPGDGMIHRLVWRIGDREALGFWAERLAAAGVAIERGGGPEALRFSDPEGLGLELRIVADEDPPLIAAAPDVAAEHAIQGFDGVRVYGSNPPASDEVFAALGFTAELQGRYRLQGDSRHAHYTFDPPPPGSGIQGAGTVHHIAWASHPEDHAAWRDVVIEAGVQPTPIIDRQYFYSIYFREPGGVLFELATIGPGFAIDEEPEHLGEALRLPPQHEHLRDRLERTLTPLANRRAAKART
jgi:glyoxalase family protein